MSGVQDTQCHSMLYGSLGQGENRVQILSPPLPRWGTRGMQLKFSQASFPHLQVWKDNACLLQLSRRLNRITYVPTANKLPDAWHTARSFLPQALPLTVHTEQGSPNSSSYSRSPTMSNLCSKALNGSLLLTK